MIDEDSYDYETPWDKSDRLERDREKEEELAEQKYERQRDKEYD